MKEFLWKKILDFKIFSFLFTDHLLLRCFRILTKVSWSGFILLRSVYIFPWKAQLKKLILQTEDLWHGFWKINRKSTLSGEKLHDLLIPNVKTWREKKNWHSETAFCISYVFENVLDAFFIFRKQIYWTNCSDFFETNYDVCTLYVLLTKSIFFCQKSWSWKLSLG